MLKQSLKNKDYVSLTAIAKIAPGRPSTNCVWRWCRRGVRGRDGERVRLQHVRIGGKIYTTRHWLDEFGRRLAEADVRYFNLCDAAESTEGNRMQCRTRSSNRIVQERHNAIDEADRELSKRGI